MNQTKTKTYILRIVFASLFAALSCVATLIIQIPTPTQGFLNLGDAIVLLSGWLLGPVYGVLAAAIGSMFADIFTSYFIYAPATFVIKGLVAFLGWLLAKTIGKVVAKYQILGYTVSAIVAELAMVLCYYLYESTVCGYGFGGAAVGIPHNLVQGAFGVVIGVILITVFDKTGLKHRLKNQLILK